MKFLRYPFLVLLCFLLAKINPALAQTLTLGTVENGPYAAGATVGVPFTIDDAANCIAKDNTFKLYISSLPGGAPNIEIGSFKGFYAPFVNGTIPASMPPGVYNLEIRSSSPATVSARANITILPGTVAKAEIKASGINTLNGEIISVCNRSFPSYMLQSIDNSGTVTVKVRDELNGTNGADLTVGTSEVKFDAQASHYTLRVLGKSGVSIATKYFLIINNPVNNQFGVSGSSTVCMANSQGVLTYNVDLGTINGIQKNFPGNTYKIGWGDGSNTEYSLCDIQKLGGKIAHTYSQESCGNNADNTFDVKISVNSPFCGAIGTPISATARVVAPPTLSFTGPLAGCVGEPVKFINSTVLSKCQTTSGIYTWYIDGVKVAEDVPFAQNLDYTFTAPGEHKVSMVIQPGSSECDAPAFEFKIVIRNKPQPKFSLPQTITCTPSIFAPQNESVVDDRPGAGAASSYLWTISPSTVTYKNGTGSTSKSPQFIFDKPGTYKIKLGVTSGPCGMVETPEQTIIVNGPPVATLSADFNTCGKGYTFSFNASADSKTFTGLSGTTNEDATTYTWTITGGNYSFENGTTLHSKYPSIKFADFGSYTIKVSHSNSCGSTEAEQKIQFFESPTVDAGPDQTICAGEKVVLKGDPASSQYVKFVKWTGGNGTFENSDSPFTTYTPSADEIAAGQVTITYEVTTTNPAPCELVTDYLTITINPKAIVTSAATKILCTGNGINYDITSSIPGTTYSWTATSSSSNLSGYSATGTGNAIKDVILNSGLSNETVTYTITPSANGCPGEPFTFTATVTPPPGNNTLGYSGGQICSGKLITVDGSAPNGGDGSFTYSWEKSNDGTNWDKVENATGKDLSITIDKPTYFRRTAYSNGCSNVSAAIKIDALPPLDNNSITANQTICINNAPGEFAGSTPTGGDGTYNFIWQKSTDNGTSWTAISGAIAKNYQSPALLQSTQFRRVATSAQCAGAQESISNVISITVGTGAKGHFTWKSESSCAPFAITADNITAQTDPENDKYTWFANGDVIGNGVAFPGYTIQTSGQTIEIRLEVTSKLGCASSFYKHTFSTTGKTLADFSTGNPTGCGPLSLNFTNTTTNPNNVTFSWDFGNGQKSNLATPPQITFAARTDGKDTVYTVVLKAVSSCGESEKSMQVRVRPAPFSRFSPDKTTGCSPLAVTFDNSSPGINNEYVWDFGDGETLTTTDNKPVVHTYNSPITRSYTVRMLAKNECGSSISEYVIRVSPNTVKPVLIVNGDELQGCAPHVVHFANNSLGANLFLYDFGDGSETLKTNQSPETVEHTFTKGGTYVVKMTASNGCSNVTVEKTITVYPQPEISFTADMRKGCTSLTVHFSNTTKNAAGYVWDFGDGKTSTEANPVHVYAANTRAYTVKLTAKSGLGCPNVLEMKDYIQVFPPPVAEFKTLPDSVIKIPQYKFSFADKSTSNPVRWEWEFGDRGFSSLKNPEHTYADTGRYKVRLIVTSAEGCKDTVTHTVQVIGVPGQLYLPNAFIPTSTDPRLQVFKANGSGLKEWRMRIYNKWGQQLWETTKLDEKGRPVEGWDGTASGAPAQQGVYVWEISAKFENGGEWPGMSYNNSAPKRTGVINLLR